MAGCGDLAWQLHIRHLLGCCWAMGACDQGFAAYVEQPFQASWSMMLTVLRSCTYLSTHTACVYLYICCSVDLVLVGAEGVVENGGVINKLGTYQIALCAKALNKPFYVAAESYKFARLYPLNQQVQSRGARLLHLLQHMYMQLHTVGDDPLLLQADCVLALLSRSTCFYMSCITWQKEFSLGRGA